MDDVPTFTVSLASCDTKEGVIFFVLTVKKSYGPLSMSTPILIIHVGNTGDKQKKSQITDH